jgi:hypothetical protein
MSQLPSLAGLPWLPEPSADFADRCRAVGAAGKTIGQEFQFLAGHRLSPRELTLLGRAIKRHTGTDLAPLSPFRLGVLSNATVDLLLDCVPASAARHGIALEVATAPYGQVVQEALSPSSSIVSRKVDAVLVLGKPRSINCGQSWTGCAATPRLHRFFAQFLSLRRDCSAAMTARWPARCAP